MPAPDGTGLLVVMIDIDPAYEEEFNRWYEEEHLPERRDCAGFLSARRYVAMDGGPKYLAIYELARPEVLDEPPYLAIAPPSPWTKQISEHFLTSTRRVYREVT